MAYEVLFPSLEVAAIWIAFYADYDAELIHKPISPTDLLRKIREMLD